MSKNTYVIRITTIDNLYADYIIEADNIFFAKIQARKAFMRDYPEADNRLKFSLNEPNTKQILEILNIIKRESSVNE